MANTGEVQESADKELIQDINDLNDDIVKQLLADLSTIVTGQNITLDPIFFATIEDRIANYTKHLGYEKIVKKYLKKFDTIDKNIFNYYSRERILLEHEILNEKLNNNFRKQVAKQFSQGMIDNTIDIADLLREQAISGASIEQTREALKTRLTTQGDTNTPFANELNNRLKDVVMTYDGLQNADLKKRFGFNKAFYLASIIETSRPICIHIKDNYKFLDDDRIKKVLDEFCPNGKPSDDVISFVTVGGETKRAKKGAGMIDGTTPDNFTINRGGWNCRHEIRWFVDAGKKEKTSEQQLDLVYG